jgi:transcriptional regulator CtsR
MHVDIPVAQIIPSILRIKNNLSNSINDKLLDVVIDKNLINDWEIGFYSDTIRKRKLSFKQEHVRKRINSKIIQSLTK